MEGSHVHDAGFEAEDYFGRVFGIGGEVAVHEVEGVVGGEAVEIGAVLDVSSGCQGSFQDLEGLLICNAVVG